MYQSACLRALRPCDPRSGDFLFYFILNFSIFLGFLFVCLFKCCVLDFFVLDFCFRFFSSIGRTDGGQRTEELGILGSGCVCLDGFLNLSWYYRDLVFSNWDVWNSLEKYPVSCLRYLWIRMILLERQVGSTEWRQLGAAAIAPFHQLKTRPTGVNKTPHRPSSSILTPFVSQYCFICNQSI